MPQHETLIPGLMERLTPGGILAVQMPMNDDEPFYRIIREVTEDAKWGFHGVELETNATCTPAEYFDLLSGCASSFDMWECKILSPTARPSGAYRMGSGHAAASVPRPPRRRRSCGAGGRTSGARRRGVSADAQRGSAVRVPPLFLHGNPLKARRPARASL